MRVCQPYAGDGSGLFYTGRAGSQVNVTFSYFQFNSARNKGGVAVALGSHYESNTTIPQEDTIGNMRQLSRVRVAMD